MYLYLYICDTALIREAQIPIGRHEVHRQASKPLACKSSIDTSELEKFPKISPQRYKKGAAPIPLLGLFQAHVSRKLPRLLRESEFLCFTESQTRPTGHTTAITRTELLTKTSRGTRERAHYITSSFSRIKGK